MRKPQSHPQIWIDTDSKDKESANRNTVGKRTHNQQTRQLSCLSNLAALGASANLLLLASSLFLALSSFIAVYRSPTKPAIEDARLEATGRSVMRTLGGMALVEGGGKVGGFSFAADLVSEDCRRLLGLRERLAWLGSCCSRVGYWGWLG